MTMFVVSSSAVATIEEMDGPPSPRANFTMTIIPSSGGSNSTEFILYGGEFYNGAENVVYDEMFKCTVIYSASDQTTKAVWKELYLLLLDLQLGARIKLSFTVIRCMFWEGNWLLLINFIIIRIFGVST